MRFKRTAASLLITVLVLALACSDGQAGPDQVTRRLARDALRDMDVTATPEGQRAVTEAAAEYGSRHGIPTVAGDLRAYRVGGELIILRHDSQVHLEERRGRAGITRPLVAGVTPQAGDGVTAQGGWEWQGGECWTSDRSQYKLVRCYKLNKFSDPVWNGDAYRNAWALHYWATVHSKSPYRLTRAKLWSRKQETSAQMRWADWAPRSDLDNSGCTDVDMTFTLNGFSVSHTLKACESWDMTPVNPGEMEQLYQARPNIRWDIDREVGLAVEVYVNQGQYPAWWLHAEIGVTI